MRDIRYEKDASQIVHLIFDRQESSANTMNAQFQDDWGEAAQRLAEEPELRGVLLRSAKKTFFAGGDLDLLGAVGPEQAGDFFDTLQRMKAAMRTIETLGVPVVACVNGTALGGGWELVLIGHHRIAIDHPKTRFGLPEATLGLLPGAGGVTRTTRLLGLETALPLLLEGKQFSPQKAAALGLIDELVETEEQMLAQAVAWIEEHPDSRQPWDQRGYRMPGGTPSHPKVAQMLAIAPAMVFSKTQGCYPAQEAVLAAAVEGAQVDVDTALRIESRYLTQLVTGKVAKNMIRVLWHQMNRIKKGSSRPDGVAPRAVEKVGVLGAGMMGAGIAWASASRGIEVLLKDVTQEGAEKGKSYSEKLVAKRIERGRMTEERGGEILDRIQPTASLDGFETCDLVIEAVFENFELKHAVTQETEAVLPETAVFASNTSTLPIAQLAAASKRPESFIGLHFFSPVDKMALVEIIRGEATSDSTLAHAYDYVLQIGKTPIVVNDSRGFYTSRVIGTYMQEGIAMVGEGVSPALIENAAALVGFPVGPLALSDEISMTLFKKVRDESKRAAEAAGIAFPEHPAYAVVERFVEQLERPGRAHGGGFYDYPEGGKKRLWAGLDELYPATGEAPSLEEVKDRLLFPMPIETVRCFDEGVLESVADANVGSILGIGFPVWTGGVIQFIEQYGVDTFVERAEQLAERHGPRFAPPESLRPGGDADRLFGVDA